MKFELGGTAIHCMRHEPRSIAEHIECLARLTGAPLSFVDQVRALFTTKGISLDAEATPFLEALDEAFRREEHIRANTFRARQELARMQENFGRVGRSYVEQHSRPREDALRKGRARSASPRSPRTTQVTIRGDHRTYIARTEREELPLVPGPREPQ